MSRVNLFEWWAAYPQKECPRTLAMYKRGVPIEGVEHRPYYDGRDPCTGNIRCGLCGQVLRSANY